MIKLYQFPHSHFSEKARWVLDHKGIDYLKINLTRGPHVYKTRKLGLSQTTVPILDHGGQIIQDSTKIINFLEEEYQELRLTPTDLALRQEALSFEKELGEEIGFHTRRYLYATLLDHPKLVSSFFLQGKPLIVKALFPLLFPRVRKKMIKQMNINPDTERESETRLKGMFDKLDGILAKNRFLIGNEFSRVDITAASLLSPLTWPKEHDFSWPSEDQIPEPLLSFRNEFKSREVFRWAVGLYRTHRIKNQV